MAILAIALLQQHDARRDILIEPAARRRAAIETRGHSQLGAFRTGGVRNWGRNRAVKTNRLVCVSVCLSGRICAEPHARSLPKFFVHVACIHGSVLLRHVYDRRERVTGVHNVGEVCYLGLPC